MYCFWLSLCEASEGLKTLKGESSDKAAVTNLFGTRDRFRGRQFFHGLGLGMVQAVLRAMGSNGERQMKLHSLARCSPPAVRLGS